MPRLDVLRVFAGAPGSGNPLGVFLDGGEVPVDRRQAVAADLGFSETVFVDDPGRGELRIFTPGSELPFAGHPLVGTAWLLERERALPELLRPPAGDVRVRRDGEVIVIAANSAWSPPFEYVQLGSPGEVEALGGPPDALGEAYCWAWIDEEGGTMRARSFAPAVGVAEDEATGSAALALSARLDREIEVHQGVGSVLAARPLGDGWAEVGGRTELDEVREYPLS